MPSLKYFLPHVEESKLRKLESMLESLSKPSIAFFVLLSGSVLLACLGLFENSAAVIIGAMIIAPLMRPLMGLAFASLTADSLLLRRSLFTIIAGTLLGGLISYFVALTLQLIELTPEMLARTHPTLLDLGVAMVAGAIGAYCQANEKLSDTLAGVAISVALVPPLGVVGIGLAQQSLSVWSGALLLYLTNLVGITIAAALVFLLMGYTPLKQAKQAIIVSIVSLIFLLVPLGLSMHELILENMLSRQIKVVLQERTMTFKNEHLQSVQVKRFKNPMEVTATVYGSETDFTPKQIKAVQEFLAKATGIPLEFHLRIVPLKEVTAVEMTPTGSATIPLIPAGTHTDPLTTTPEPKGLQPTSQGFTSAEPPIPRQTSDVPAASAPPPEPSCKDNTAASR